MNQGKTNNTEIAADAPPAVAAAKAAAAAQKPPPSVAAQLKRMERANKDPKVQKVRAELKRQGDMARDAAKNPPRPNRAAFARQEYDAQGRQVDGEPPKARTA